MYAYIYIYIYLHSSLAQGARLGSSVSSHQSVISQRTSMACVGHHRQSSASSVRSYVNKRYNQLRWSDVEESALPQIEREWESTWNEEPACALFRFEGGELICRFPVKHTFVHFRHPPVEQRSRSVPPQLKLFASNGKVAMPNQSACPHVAQSANDDESTCGETPDANSSDDGSAHSSPRVSFSIPSISGNAPVTPSRLSSLRAAGDAIMFSLKDTDPRHSPSTARPYGVSVAQQMQWLPAFDGMRPFVAHAHIASHVMPCCAMSPKFPSIMLSWFRWGTARITSALAESLHGASSAAMCGLSLRSSSMQTPRARTPRLRFWRFYKQGCFWSL